MERIYSNNLTINNNNMTYLKNLSRHMSIYICLFYVIVGNISCIFKILFFLQKPLRTCPCSAYVIAATINDCITLNNIPILNILSNVYPSKNWIYITINRPSLFKRQNERILFSSSSTINTCKIRNYLHMWSTDVSVYILLFASINRFIKSSKNSKRITNQRLTNIFCNYFNAIKICFGIYIIGALVSLHHYFNFTVITHYCMPKSFILWAIWIFDIHCLIPSTFMIIFSTLTLINVRENSKSSRRHYRRSTVISRCYQNSCFNRSTDYNHHIERQLTSMIITETIGTILTIVPYAIYVMYQVVKPDNEKNLEVIAWEDFIEQLIRLTMYLEPSCGFYIYLFTLTTLRKRFIGIILNKLRFF